MNRCLDSVAHLVDEIIIMDTGSTDQTKEIARQYPAKIYDFTWIDDFAAARNAAFAKATQEYILWLDADDVISEADQEKLLKLKQSLNPSVDTVTFLYHIAFDKYGNLSFSLRRNRLVKRTRNFQWHGAVHEYLEVYGEVCHSEIAVIHKSDGAFSDRNLKIYQKKWELNHKFSPRDLYYYGNELFDHQRFKEAIPIYEKFLDEGEGWIEDNIACCGKLADCYYHLGNKQHAIRSILRAFSYDGPRPEFCCRLGYHFLENRNYLVAAYWYRLATPIPPKDNFLGFTNSCYTTWLPHLQLCVCYSHLKAYKLAYLHNEVARSYRPEDPIIINNKLFLESLPDLKQ